MEVLQPAAANLNSLIGIRWCLSEYRPSISVGMIAKLEERTKEIAAQLHFIGRDTDDTDHVGRITVLELTCFGNVFGTAEGGRLTRIHGKQLLDFLCVDL